MHTCVPARQLPTPSWGCVLHSASSPSVQPQVLSLVSAMTLQSLLSVEEQSRAAGPTAPVHGPNALVPLLFPVTHVCTPAVQMPLPSSPGCSEQSFVSPTVQVQNASSSLSGVPSQSLSRAERQSRGWAL